MPPEFSSWDRKDFVRERKFEIADTSAGKSKDSYQKSGDALPFHVSRSGEGPRVTCFGKQGNYRLSPEEPGYLIASGPATEPRSHDRMTEDDIRTSSSHPSDGKTGKSSRDLKSEDTASLKGAEREWKGYQSDDGDGYFASPTGRHEESGRYTGHPYLSHLVAENSWNHHPSEKQNEKMGAVGFNGRYSERGMDVQVDRPTGLQCGYSHENSLGSIRWNPLKWARTSRVSSWGSVISQSGGRKFSRTEVGDGSDVARKATLSRSPSAEAVTSTIYAVSADGSHSLKKQRLSWGQGLAKYEKEKVEGQEEVCGENVPGFKAIDLKTTDFPYQEFSDGSLRVGTLRASTGIASLPPCRSSPGAKDRDIMMDAGFVSYLCSGGSINHGSHGDSEEFLRNLDNLDIKAVDSLISDLMHHEDSFAKHTNFLESASLSKLTSLKTCIMKLLEKKECELDQSENELRSLSSEIDIVTGQVATNLCDDTREGTIGKTNKSEKATSGSNPLAVSPQSSPSALAACIQSSNGVASQTDKSVNLCQTCELNVVGEASTIIDLLRIPHDEEIADEPSLIDKGPGTLAAHQSGNCLVQVVVSFNAFASSNKLPFGDANSTSISSILALNKELAGRASADLMKFLPVGALPCDGVLQGNPSGTSHSMVGTERISANVEANFARRRRHLRFKERALIFKFRVFQYLWKEDLRLLSIRKHQPKQQKRFEQISYTFQNGSQKNRSSIRSRFTSPAGNLTLVPTREVVAFRGELLSHTQIKVYRNNLKMPALILEEERNSLRFVSWNGLVEDPCSVEKERTMINPWTSEERDAFVEYLGVYGKDFSRIASLLKHKTTADCVEFYYKNHKSEVFATLKKLRWKSKRSKAASTNAFLVTSGKKWNHESTVASLDTLGAASVASCHARESQHAGLKYMEGSSMDGYYDCEMSELEDGVLERTGDRRITANASEAVSSCVIGSIDPGDGSNEWNWKYHMMDNGMETPVTPDVMQNIEDDSCSDESSSEVASSDWTDAEKAIFITAVRSHGKDFATVSRCVGSRSANQCKIFFSKARKCLGLDMIHISLGNEGTPVRDTHGGCSDTEDACAEEMDSGFCSARSCYKIEKDDFPVGFGSSMVSSSNEGYGCPRINLLPVKGSITADTEKRIARSVQDNQIKNDLEIQIENDGHPADSLIEASLLDYCNVVMVREKSKGTDLKLEHDEGASTVDVASQKHEVSGPAVEIKGPEIQLPACQIGDSSSYSERTGLVNADVAADLAQNVVSGLPDFSREKSEGQLATQNCSSEQVPGGASSNQHDPYSHAVVPSLKGKDHVVNLSGRNHIDHQNNGLFNCMLDVNKNSQSLEEEISPTGICSVSKYNSKVSDGLLTSREVLACCQILPVPWRDESTVSNASATSHHDASGILEVEQLLPCDPFDVRQKQVREPERTFGRSAMTDSYKQSGGVHQPVDKVDLPVQNLKGFSLQSFGVGTTSSVCDKQQVHHSMTGLRNLHDFRNNLTLQNQFFAEENGNGDGHLKAHLEYSLFLPKMDDLGGTAESIFMPASSLFEASCGVKVQTKAPENDTQTSKPGEVKLFGRNLVLHPPMNKAVSTQTESNQHAVRKEQNNGVAGLNLSKPKSTAEILKSNYGFWDGTRTQTGLRALPDSSLLLSNGSRVRHPRSTSCHMKEQRTMSAGKVDDRKFNRSREATGTSEISNNHIYSSDPVQPFTVDVSRPVVLSDLHKSMLIEKMQQQPLLGLQHQIQVVGSTNTVNHISDPVVALKLQCTEKFCMGKRVREEDSWRGDINR